MYVALKWQPTVLHMFQVNKVTMLVQQNMHSMKWTLLNTNEEPSVKTRTHAHRYRQTQIQTHFCCCRLASNLT